MENKEKIIWMFIYESIIFFLPYFFSDIEEGMIFILIVLFFIFGAPFVFFIFLLKDLKISRFVFHSTFIIMGIQILIIYMFLFGDFLKSELNRKTSEILEKLMLGYPIYGSIIGYLGFNINTKIEKFFIRWKRRKELK